MRFRINFVSENFANDCRVHEYFAVYDCEKRQKLGEFASMKDAISAIKEENEELNSKHDLDEYYG